MKIKPQNMTIVEAHHLMTSIVLPRPIAWVSTMGVNGVANLAPFSFYGGICCVPPTIGLGLVWSRHGEKNDTLVNIEATGEYVIGMVEEATAGAMNASSYPFPPDVSEFKEAGLTPVKADIVKAPLIGESPVNMECRMVQVIEFGKAPRTSFVIGEVVCFHIKDGLYADGEVKISKIRPIARLGGELYCRVTDIFEMKRPR